MSRRHRANDLTITAQLEARFWAKVDQSGGPDACHPWTAARIKTGYGLFAALSGLPGQGSRMVSAHTVAYRLSHGMIPKGLVICHSCDNRACCNPRHLRADTMKANVRDMCVRGRQWQAKLNPARVYGLRLLRQGFGLEWKDIARLFGIAAPSTVYHAFEGSWQWVPKPPEYFDPRWRVEIDWVARTVKPVK